MASRPAATPVIAPQTAPPVPGAHHHVAAQHHAPAAPAVHHHQTVAPQPVQLQPQPVAQPAESGLNLTPVDPSTVSRFRTSASSAAPAARPEHSRFRHAAPQAAPVAAPTPTPVVQEIVATQPVTAAPAAAPVPQPVTQIATQQQQLAAVREEIPLRSLPIVEPAAAAPIQATPAINEAPVAPVESAPLPTLARQVPMDMDLPGEASHSPFDRIKNARWRKLDPRQLGLKRTAAAALVLFVLAGGFAFSQGFLTAHKVFKGGTATAAALKADVDPSLLKGEGSGRINILLLGRGGGDHDAPDLTDTIMLASVDPINHKTTLFSVPRDLWVNVDGSGVMKLNAAYETGIYKYLGKSESNTKNSKAIQAGFSEVDQTLENVLGVNIDYNMVVDFKAFQQAVDTVGGVNIDVPTDLVDPTMAWENNNDPVLAKAGIQAFDGKHALIYARSRETTSDFARGQRQRTLMLALKDKIETLGTLTNPLKLSGLINAFGDNVSTDLSLSNAKRLASIVKGVGDSGVNSVGLADNGNAFVTTGNINGQSVVLPKAGLFNYADIQDYVRSQLKDPFIVKENAKVLVLNGTTTPGVASNKADELKSYGYNVVGTANTPNTGWTQTTLVDLTHKKKYTKHYLEQHFNQTAASSLADQTIPTNGADFVIIIGSDETTAAQTQAH